MRERSPKTYRVLTISLYASDADEADRLTGLLRQGGWSNANRSLVMREGLLRLQEELSGKSSNEIVQYFTERQAARARVRSASPSAPIEVMPEPSNVTSAAPDLALTVTVVRDDP